jgi:cell division protein FtsA
MSKIIGAVEIGTSYTKALIGEVSEDRSLNIVGKSLRRNEGMRKGEIVDFRKTASSVHSAIEDAEKMSGTTVDSIYLAQTGSHLKGTCLRGSANVASPDGRVSLADLKRAAEEAKRKQPPAGRSYVHHVRMPIRLDGRSVEDPVGMMGQKVELAYWSIEGDESPIRMNLDLAYQYGLEVDDLILSSIASATLVAGPDKRRAGVLVVDIGAGVTDIVLYLGGNVVFTAVIPVGGDHLTGDLAMGLRVLEPYAEELKLEYGKAQADSSDSDQDLWIIGNKTIGDRTIPRKAIADIIHVRVVELFEIISKELSGLLDSKELGAGVLLTGGTSRLPGIEQLASKVLGLPVTKGSFPAGLGHELAQPENSTVLGLLHYGLEDHRLPGEQNTQSSTGLFKKIGGFLGI